MGTKPDCPKCPTGKLDPLTVQVQDRARPGRRGATAALTVDRCAACGGIWFDAGELDKYLDAKLRPVDSPQMSAEAHAKADALPGKCPRCQGEMAKGTAPNNPKITADSCPRCGGAWLDGGELAQVEKGGASLGDALRSVFGDLRPG